MRNSGILLPISSLPSKYGIGTLGKEAYKFIDFLEKGAQHYWQILPIGPTSYGDSPYQSFSAFALNPYFIDLDMLAEDGYLRKEEYTSTSWNDTDTEIDYNTLYTKRLNVLKLASARLNELDGDFQYYKANNVFWLDDFALFMAIKAMNGGKPFIEWDEKIIMRESSTMEKLRTALAPDIHFWRATQYFFHKQWIKLKQYANSKGIKIIGDIPIYVSPDSSDLWADSELFQVDENKKMIDVAGCPPDPFAENGQLWGNPLYDWDYHKETGYDWWVKRIRYSADIFDVVRIDHFRGFAGYYAIPASHETAKYGQWRTGPSTDLINAIKNSIPNASIIAEDLGFLTDDVYQLLKDSGFPGMKILQFAFDSDSHNEYLPHNYYKNCVCYTGTHDNFTTLGWIKQSSEKVINFAKEYLGETDTDELTYALIRAAMSSVANLSVIPLQDWLKMDNSARINTPSTLGGNWVWRMEKGACSDELAQVIRRFTEIYGRL